jgi:hypothetical protein
MAILPRNPDARQSGNSKGKLGCLGNMTALLIGILGVFLLLNPWAVHIGDRWTPALFWHGTGTLHSTTGAHYPLYLEIWLEPSGSGYRRANLRGRSILCTQNGQRYGFTVYGYLTHAWLDTDGKRMQVLLFSPKNSKPTLKLDLIGTWKGQELLLDDKGNMAMSFNSDGSAKGYLIGTNSPKEDTTGTLHYAPQSEFESACPASAATF